jgi:hypothetical protein
MDLDDSTGDPEPGWGIRQEHKINMGLFLLNLLCFYQAMFA